MAVRPAAVTRSADHYGPAIPAGATPQNTPLSRLIRASGADFCSSPQERITMPVLTAHMRAPLLRRPDLWQPVKDFYRFHPDRCCRQLSFSCLAIAILLETAAM